jgi:hypothetical protein
MAMGTQRWLNQTQPQTLVIAVMLFYIDAAFLGIFGVLGGGFAPLSLLFLVGFIGAGYGIANERKWGYWLGLVIAAVRLIFVLLPILTLGMASVSLLNVLFAGAKVALLVHPMSREYQRVWFK